MTDEQLLKNRIYDLAERADSAGTYTCTGFLSPMEQEIWHAVKKDLPVGSFLYGGTEAAIRKMAVFGSEELFGYAWEPCVKVLRISPRNERFASECTHRDYLGSLMSLGIDRRVTGDIIVHGKEAWIFVLDSAADFIAENLTNVRRNDVLCEEVSGDVPDLSPRFEDISANIASERLDLIIGAAAGVKREDAKKLLGSERIFVNERLVSSSGHRLKEGDVIVIRGFGKFIYDGVKGTSRKGRLYAALRKYV